MEIKYLGHSCFYFKLHDTAIIVDPFISPNPLASKIDVDDIKVDYILVTHGHEDHIADVLRIAENNAECTIISNFEISLYFQGKGLKTIGMNHGGKISFNFGTIKMVNAVHTSGMPDGSYGGQAAGFVVWNSEFSFYIAGDTAVHYDMKLIPELCPRLDFAILPIGDHFTMGIEEALLAANFAQATKVIACHFDTFDILKLDRSRAKDLFTNEGIDLIIPAIGQTIDYN